MPCDLCGDPAAAVQPHSEDYAEPFLWERPAVYALCSRCHSRVHGRFAAPEAWLAYKAHVRRGGFGADLDNPVIAREIGKLGRAWKLGHAFPLPQLRARPLARVRPEWWELLSTDVRFLDQPLGRPR